MEELRSVAFLSVGRACGFAGLAIVCVLIGLAHDPVAAAKGGGVLTMLLTLGLVLKARLVPSQDVRRTEAWIMLDEDRQPPRAYAQWAMSTVLHDAYLWFARQAAAVSVAFWVLAAALSLAGL